MEIKVILMECTMKYMDKVKSEYADLLSSDFASKEYKITQDGVKYVLLK